MSTIGSQLIGTGLIGGCGEITLTPSARIPDKRLSQSFSADLNGQVWPFGDDPFELLLGLGSDAALFVLVLWSLFTDARAPESAPLPANDTDRRGWWADSFTIKTPFTSDLRPKGSKLWLLKRAKAEDGHAARVQEYTVEALAWMKKAGLADSVECSARMDRRTNVLAARTVIRANGKALAVNFKDFWKVYDYAKTL